MLLPCGLRGPLRCDRCSLRRSWRQPSWCRPCWESGRALHGHAREWVGRAMSLWDRARPAPPSRIGWTGVSGPGCAGRRPLAGEVGVRQIASRPPGCPPRMARALGADCGRHGQARARCEGTGWPPRQGRVQALPVRGLRPLRNGRTAQAAIVMARDRSGYKRGPVPTRPATVSCRMLPHHSEA